VHNFFEYSTPAVLQELKDMAIACIGPITEGALRKHGFSAGIVPEKYDFTSLAEAIIKYYKELRSGGVQELRSIINSQTP
jgi:uroporphyrinogen-III synthase